MAKKRKVHTTAEQMQRAFKDMMQVVESFSGAKTAEFYVQMAAWLLKTTQKTAATFRAIPDEKGKPDREVAAAALDALADGIQAMLRDFHDKAKAAEEVRGSMDAIPPKVEFASREMVRAMAASAGYAVTDDDITVEEARDRLVKAMAEAKADADAAN